MTNGKALGTIALAALLVSTGCGKTKPGDKANATQTAEGTAGTEAANEAVPEVEANSEAVPVGEEASGSAATPVKNLVAAHNGGVVRIAPKADSSAPVRVAAGGALSRYVDMHPREVEGGRSFLGEPVVRKAIAANVRDARIRDFIYHYNGPDAPIASKGGRLYAWGCEVHNCGFHNWTVSIRPDGSGAEICHYQNDEAPDGTSTWYLPGGRSVKRDGNCPDG